MNKSDGILETYALQDKEVLRLDLKNIDLKSVYFEEQVAKVEEEQEEFWEALEGNNKEHIMEEFFDVVQALTGLLSFYGISATRLNNYYPTHVNKIKDRPRKKETDIGNDEQNS